MRLSSILLLVALAGCQTAFQRAQDNTQGFAAGGNFSGTGEAFFGTRFAYVVGDFHGTIGAYWEGAALWTHTATGATSKAWELYFDAATKRPAVRASTVDVAKAALARALPAVAP